MARRERERYTERNRPGRQTAGSGGGGEQGPAMKNPAVLVAIAGLVVAGAMALGFLFARGDAPQTAETPEELATTPAEMESGETGDEAEMAAEDGAADDMSEGDASDDEPAEGEAAEGGTGDEMDAAASDTSSRANMYESWEDQNLDPEGTAYFATIATDKGDIELELFPEVAPDHVNSFIFLAREGYYDGLVFHRVEPGFVIQGGDPLGMGTGGPGYNVPAEFNSDDPVPHRAGTLAMARSGDPNSGGSQFYVVIEDGPGPSSLDGQYTVFGHTIGGMNVVRQIAVGDVMNSVTIREAPKSESVVSPDDIREGNLPDGIE